MATKLKGQPRTEELKLLVQLLDPTGPFRRIARGSLAALGLGKALYQGIDRFEPGPYGTTIAKLQTPIPGGEYQAMGGLVLENPNANPKTKDLLLNQHELGHTLQSEYLGVNLPTLQWLLGKINEWRGKGFYADPETGLVTNPVELTAPTMATLFRMFNPDYQNPLPSLIGNKFLEWTGLGGKGEK